MTPEKPTILALSKSKTLLLEALNAHLNVVSEAEYEHHAEAISAIETSSKHPVPKALIDALPNLEIIASSSAGVDNIDLRHAWSKGIKASHAPDPIKRPTAALALSHILSMTRGTHAADDFVRSGAWANAQNRVTPGVDISHKKVGIIGLGGIGADLAAMLRVFQIDILYTARADKNLPDATYYDSVTNMAHDCDVLVACCNLNEQTQGMVNADVLNALGSEGYFVNVARGGVVNEPDLIEALQNDRIAGAALDVFADEPNVPEALIALPKEKIIFSPHIGAKTTDAELEMANVTVQNLLAHFAGEDLPDEVPLHLAK